MKTRLLIVLLAATAVLAACELDLDDSCDDCDYDSWDDGGWCSNLCDDIYDCGMQVRYYSERECREYCDSYSSLWDCIDDCYDQYACRAQTCIDACTR